MEEVSKKNNNYYFYVSDEEEDERPKKIHKGFYTILWTKKISQNISEDKTDAPSTSHDSSNIYIYYLSSDGEAGFEAINETIITEEVEIGFGENHVESVSEVRSHVSSNSGDEKSNSLQREAAAGPNANVEIDQNSDPRIKSSRLERIKKATKHFQDKSFAIPNSHRLKRIKKPAECAAGHCRVMSKASPKLVKKN